MITGNAISPKSTIQTSYGLKASRFRRGFARRPVITTPLDSLVSAEILSSLIGKPDIKIIDGTWVMPGTENPLPEQYIPGAQHFDIDAIADPDSAMAHMLPPLSVFTTAMQGMGITNNDHVIVYDRHGIRAAPRVWWMFQMFGHKNVSLLDGGLPAWIKAGLKTCTGPAKNKTPSHYQARPALSSVCSFDDIKARLGTDIQILDARAKNRFDGKIPEPRQGLRSGHIPGSQSLPYTALLTSTHHFKPLEDLRAEMRALNIDLNRPIITSCGSGVTAAIIAFTLHRLGAKDVSVYDGSWVEWGASDAPVSSNN